nr:NUDIX domain-containing protein [Halobacillus andaensis]
MCFNNKGELLFMKRSDNHQWGLPGGSLELGEKLEETAVRELFEETGLQAQNLTFQQIYSGKELHYIYPNGDEVYNVIAAYTCEYDGSGWNSDSEETLAIQFWPLENLPAQMCSPDRFVVEKVKEGEEEIRR